MRLLPSVDSGTSGQGMAGHCASASDGRGSHRGSHKKAGQGR